MLAPKKGLLCNLNHIHLQHVSLGLHLSRHPELRDAAGSGEQKRCGGCRESCEQVDANCNSPSLRCRCCESHPEPPATLGLQNRAAPGGFPHPLPGEEAESPCDPPSTSSSLSSCSDLSPDESPLSVCYRGFPAGGTPSPAEPPPGAEDAELGEEQRGGGGSPGSLCSSGGGGGGSLDSRDDEERSAATAPGLDPNCNPLPGAEPRRWEPSPSDVPPPIPPPVPPRPKRRLQLLQGHGAEPPGAERCGDAAKKNITSFHELAQKRKRSGAGAAPVAARPDRSDWLIVFSPDTELPPHRELLPGTAAPRDPAQPQPERGLKAAGAAPREVTTFKELRCRSASGKAKAPPPAPAPAPGGSCGSGRAPPAAQAPRRPRPAPRPIAERRPGERPGCSGRSWRSAGAAGSRRGPGEAEHGEEPRRDARPAPPASGAPGAAQPHGDGPAGRRGALAEQKKALLVAVSAAVDKVVAHFGSARNVVQKAQLGDSWLSPDVGYLLLHTLCPALYGLVEDGLKPFQKDVITGQRRNSPWSVVEASVKTGPNTRSLHNLCWRVAGLAPLSSTRQKFHAFILGLLNTKQLEQWVSHLQNSPGVISMLYFPTAFFALSQGPLPHLADELLLLIQPLSVLTFHLDLLFEHHHLSVDVRPLSRHVESPPSPARHFAQGAAQPPEGQSGAAGGSVEDELPPDTLGRAPAAEESPRSQCQAAVRSPQVGAALQQTLQHVLRWGDQLSRAFLGADSSLGAVRPEAGPWDTGAGPSSWWAQLSQASRIYAAPSKERFPFVWWTKLRTAAGDSSPGQAARPQTPLREPKGTELQLLQTKAIPELSSPNSSSNADTSGTSSPEDMVLLAGTPPPSAGPAAGEKPLAASPEPGAGRSQAAPPDPGARSPGPDRGSWLGRLFGASSPSARSSPPSPDGVSVRSRRPSSWLAPSSRVLAVVVKGLVAEKNRAPEQPERKVPDLTQTHRAVRALCDHTGAADGHLSFQKGDVLQLLSTVDEDWIRCCHGNSTGLVPVGYTSLIL